MSKSILQTHFEFQVAGLQVVKPLQKTPGNIRDMRVILKIGQNGSLLMQRL